MTYRKKLIEVALPLKAINEASAREKSIRHGHPSTLHLWWARRPLAACRAVLFASLVNDPGGDPMYGASEEIAGSERAKLFNLIEELVKWENSNNPDVINRARAEIARSIAANNVADGKWKNDQVVVHLNDQAATAHDFKHKLARPDLVNAFLGEHAPPVLDPFCGGGSIPLEAQRLGLRAYASDLNPVPVLITKALIEIPPKFVGRPPVNPDWQRKTPQEKAARVWQAAAGLAEDVRYYGQWIRDEAEKRIGHLYPKVKITKQMATDRPDLEEYVGQELTVIAWLWARTVKCPNPACGGDMPLVSSFNLSSRRSNRAFVRPRVPRGQSRVVFDICIGNDEVPDGVVNRRGATCTLCRTAVAFEYVRAQGASGKMNQQLMAIVAEGREGRVFLAADPHQEAAAARCQPPQCVDTDLPEGGLGFRVQRYGITKHRQLFTARQLAALCTFADISKSLLAHVLRHAVSAGMEKTGLGIADGGTAAQAYAGAITTYVSLAVSKAADLLSSLCHWQPNPEHLKLAPTFARPTLSMTWDFAEGNPFSSSSGNFLRQPELIEKVLVNWVDGHAGFVEQRDAQAERVDSQPVLVSTDPPYYDNIGYADLSDFFYVWLRRMLQPVYPMLFSTLLVPKSAELVSDPSRHGGQESAREFFERGLERTFCWVANITRPDTPFSIYYAFKQSEVESNDDGREESNVSTGWEAMLEGLARSGFNITGTWPVRTERVGRPRDNASNALASSIVLTCRQRAPNAPLATRKEFMKALRTELPQALRNLQHGNIAPVDVAQAAIGPGMAVFTRYAKVLETDGSAMTVRTALALINQALDEVLAEQEGDVDADTRWALAWFEQFGLDQGPFGDAETLSKAKNTAVNGLVESGILRAKGGRVRLIRRDELNGQWDPAADRRLTVWEVTQHLIRTLDTQGESGAANLINKLGGMAETARDLAYRLYSACAKITCTNWSW